jgi:hypothetical protein
MTFAAAAEPASLSAWVEMKGREAARAAGMKSREGRMAGVKVAGLATVAQVESSSMMAGR